MLKEFSKFTIAITLTVARITESTENTMLFIDSNKTKRGPLGMCYLYRTLLGIGSRGSPVLLQPRKEKCL